MNHTQQPKQELSGSAEYLATHKFDPLTKGMQKAVRDAETSKKLIILSWAEKFEKKGYPITKICKKVTDDLADPEYAVSDSYVRKILPAKYKDPEQMATAFQQKNGKSHAGATDYRLKEQVQNKDIMEIGVEDIKFLSPRRLQQVAKFGIEKRMWHEQQDKQGKRGEDLDTIAKLRTEIIEKNKIIAQLEKDINGLVEELFQHVMNPKMSDAQVGKEVRAAFKKFQKMQQKEKEKET